MENTVSICGVVVTYNRVDKLQKVLDTYSNQTFKPAHIIVIDNCSDNETSIFLEKWKKKDESFNKIVYRLSENTGGAGGFAKGFEIALSLKCDWIYIGDDDAYLSTNLFELFSKRPELAISSVGAIASCVDSPDGISYHHRRKVKKGVLSFKEIASKPNDYLLDCLNIDLFSFVGVFLRKECVSKIGLPNASYFIWYDDSEYSYRFSKHYNVVCVPALKVFHDCPKESIAFCWKSYYGYRNKLLMLKNDVGKRYYLVFRFMLWCSSLLDSLTGKRIKGKVKRIAISDAKRNIAEKNTNFLPGVILGVLEKKDR